MYMEHAADLASIQSQIDELKQKVNALGDARKDQLCIAVVSGGLDKVLAAMIISIAAAASDTRVKLFFSFWALTKFNK